MDQGCLKAFAFGLMLLGALLGLLGLVFIIAPNQGATGYVLMAIAVGILAFAGSRLRAMKSLSSEGVEQQIMAVAANANGELTIASVAGSTGLPDRAVRHGLERLLKKGLAQVEMRDGVAYYLFAGIKQEKMIKKCLYCGNEYPLSQAGRTCPSCGGNLEIRAE